MSFADLEKWRVTPLREAPYLSVVVPVAPPVDRLLPGLTKIASYVSGLNFPWEMIVVVIDTIKNPELTQALQGLRFANLKIVDNPQPGHKGSAVQAGMLAAGGNFVLLDDPDHATPIQELGKFLPPVRSGESDIAAGVRKPAGKPKELRTWLQRSSMGRLYQTVSWVFRLRVEDPLCGFKLYNRQAAQVLHGAQTFRGNGWEMEVFYLAGKWGYRVKEIPVGWVKGKDRPDPQNQALKYIGDMLILWRNDLRGNYKTQK